jgi:hypothetical protein
MIYDELITESSDLGPNAIKLYEKIANRKNKIFVDLGVRHGISSKVMLIDADINGNKVYGIDVDDSFLHSSVRNNQHYNFLMGDSVTVGKYWNEKINGLFVDTFHIKQQVLCELFFWFEHVEEGGFIAFHDTNWPENKHDVYGGIIWPRVEEAIKLFFNIDSLNYVDEYIKVVNYPDYWGLTIVDKIKHKNFKENIENWSEIFKSRNQLISIFWNENNIGNRIIDLNIYV